MRSLLLSGLALVLLAGTSGRAGDEPVMVGKTVDQWVAIFRDKNDPSIEARVANALGRIGPAAAPAVPALRAKLKQGDFASGISSGPSRGLAGLRYPSWSRSFRKKQGISSGPARTCPPV